MPVSYETDNRLKALAPVIDEHAEWFLRAVRRIFYPETGRDRGQSLSPPESFNVWIKDAAHDQTFGKHLIEDVQERYRALHAKAGKLIGESVEEGRKPDLEAFDSFLALYDSFIFALRRVEQDCVLADSGIDILSGLRSASAMKKDLERELERRARRGKPFCLVLARIDDYGHMKNAVSEKRLRDVTQVLAKLIKLCLRNFDDAYRLEDGEFVMSLKQSETAGGSAAVDRLRKLLKEENIQIPNRGRDVPLTMSYCVAEPVPGDTFDDLLKNMRADLVKYKDGGNTSLEYIEQSPLQRFIKDKEET